jgi:hypothetical protein
VIFIPDKYDGNFGVVWLFKENVNANGTFPLLEWEGNSWLHVLFGLAMVTKIGQWNGLLINSNVIDILKRGIDFPATESC